MEKWKSFPEDQHTPLCAHLLGLAMKTVTQLALGESFRDDAEVISFRKNHNAVRQHPSRFSALDSDLLTSNPVGQKCFFLFLFFYFFYMSTRKSLHFGSSAVTDFSPFGLRNVLQN